MFMFETPPEAEVPPAARGGSSGSKRRKMQEKIGEDKTEKVIRSVRIKPCYQEWILLGLFGYLYGSILLDYCEKTKSKIALMYLYIHAEVSIVDRLAGGDYRPRRWLFMMSL